jgi:predicted transposase YbfD/YdcC
METNKNGIWVYFEQLEDPRERRHFLHKLEDLITIAVLGVICGVEAWTEMEDFGRIKKEFLQTFLELPNGIPSHDTFRRLFMNLDPEAFERCLMKWTEALSATTEGKLVSIDGKCLRRSFDRAGEKAAIHMVSAWVEENQAVFGQVKVEDKSNEITAMPKLLALLNLQKATVTIDAIGCQQKIAAQIVEQGGDYLLALKGNQTQLHEDVSAFFTQARAQNFAGITHQFQRQQEKGHGREEERCVWVTEELSGLRTAGVWRDLRSLVMVERNRKVGQEAGTNEVHWYISSLPSQAVEKIAGAIRGHWKIENQLHWRLDVTFHEDQGRLRAGHGAENFSRLRRMALNLIQQHTCRKKSVKRRQKMAGWDNRFLLKCLGLGEA